MNTGTRVFSIIPLPSHQKYLIPANEPLTVVSPEHRHGHHWFPVTAVEYITSQGKVRTTNCETAVLKVLR